MFHHNALNDSFVKDVKDGIDKSDSMCMAAG